MTNLKIDGKRAKLVNIDEVIRCKECNVIMTSTEVNRCGEDYYICERCDYRLNGTDDEDFIVDED